MEGEPDGSGGRLPPPEDAPPPPVPAEQVKQRMDLFRDGPLKMDELKRQ
jgi:chemotaxis protein MotB